MSALGSTTVARNDQAINVLHEISNILDTGLDKETLRILVGLCEAGVNPEALATVVGWARGRGSRAMQHGLVFAPK